MDTAKGLFSMAGKVAIVTGAGSGMGAEFARALARAGAKVACGGRRLDKVMQVSDAIKDEGYDAIALKLDIGENESVSQAFDQVEAEFGVADVLVNNAGQIVFAPFPDVDDDAWSNLINVNYTGTMRMAREFSKRLIAAERPGAIVNITSNTGIQVLRNVPGYGSIKAGLNHLTGQIAADLFEKNIRCNAIAPGYFATDMVDWYFETEQGKAEIERLPLRRVGKVEELTGALLLLASDASSYINGVVLPVDAGHSVLLS